MSNNKTQDTCTRTTKVTRRELMASGTALAAASVALAGNAADARAHRSSTGPAGDKVPKPPFDSMRDYVAALDAHGLLRRFSGVDQSSTRVFTTSGSAPSAAIAGASAEARGRRVKRSVVRL